MIQNYAGQYCTEFTTAMAVQVGLSIGIVLCIMVLLVGGAVLGLCKLTKWLGIE